MDPVPKKEGVVQNSSERIATIGIVACLSTLALALILGPKQAYGTALQSGYTYCQSLDRVPESQRMGIVDPHTSLACQEVERRYVSGATPTSYLEYLLR